MNWKSICWVGSFATLFFFLPSLAGKLWETLAFVPWQYKRWFIYSALAWLAVIWIRRRWSKQVAAVKNQKEDSLLDIAKKRLVRGEIGLDEFRQIRDELKME